MVHSLGLIEPSLSFLRLTLVAASMCRQGDTAQPNRLPKSLTRRWETVLAYQAHTS